MHPGCDDLNTSEITEQDLAEYQDASTRTLKSRDSYGSPSPVRHDVGLRDDEEREYKQ